MKKMWLFAVSCVAWVMLCGSGRAQDLTGTWQGTLHAGKDLRTVLKISKGDGGTGFKAVFYSIDQGGQPIPVKSVVLQGSTVKMEIAVLDGTYEGKVNPDFTAIVGTWTQGKPLELNLTKATTETAWTIPEPPAKIPPMAVDAKPVFDVATVKPTAPDAQGKGIRVNGRHFSTLNTSLNDLIEFAYGVQVKQIVGGSPWMDTDKYDLAAQPDLEGAPNDKQWKAMLQKLLTDRFKLTFHRDKKELSVYALGVGKGQKLTKRDDEPDGLPGLFFRGGNGISLNARNSTMGDFVGLLQEAVLDRPVIDQTALPGRYDFTLKFMPDDSMMGGMGAKLPPTPEGQEAPPGLFAAVQDQLGLKLEATKAPAEVLVIDHVEKPTDN